MACESGCSGCSGCTSCSGCSGCRGCSGCTNCTGTCEGSCTCCNGCSGTCTADCSNSCYNTCEGNCFETCLDSCYETCTGQCKGYCSEICQTYCQTEQTFSQNVSPIPNAIGVGAFGEWSNPVATNATIRITSGEWNKLKELIRKAIPYCGGTSPSSRTVSSGDPITAAEYNELANGINVASVTKDVTIISADIINALRTGYNSRQIINSLPAGEYTGGQNQCCQSDQICMASGELLSHQAKTEECADQTPTKCGDQTPK